MNSFRVIEKALPFITAATPGAFRIFVLGYAGFFLAKDKVIYFSTEYTLTAFFVMISGIGFSTILIKRMAQDDNFTIFSRYACSSVLVGGSLATILLLMISYLVPVPDFWAVLLLILTTTLYQVFRNYLVFKKCFWQLLINDLIVAFAFITAILTLSLYFNKVKPSHVLNLLSFSYLLAFSIMILGLRIRKELEFKIKGLILIPKEDIASSLVVGFSNAASSGVGFILPSFFAALGGSNIAIVASFSAAVFSAMSALPRGLINNSASALSKMVMVGNYSKELVVNLRAKIHKLILFLVPILSVFIFLYFYMSAIVTDYWIVLFFIFVFSFNVATGQLGVVESMLINICGYERISFIFNMVTFLFVMLVFLLIKLLPAAQDILLIMYAVPFALGILNIFRMYWYRKLVIDFFNKS